MAHECMFCGQMCYCDIEDLEHDEMPDDCPHWDCEGTTDDEEFDYDA